MALQCVLWQEDLMCLSAQCPEHEGGTGRQANTPGDVEVAAGGQQPHSKTAIWSFVQGATGGALPEPYKTTFYGPLMCRFLLKQQPRAHCTSIWSDNGSEDLIPVPNGSHGTSG